MNGSFAQNSCEVLKGFLSDHCGALRSLRYSFEPSITSRLSITYETVLEIFELLLLDIRAVTQRALGTAMDAKN